MENSAGAAGQNDSSKDIKNGPIGAAQYHPNLWGDHFLNYTPPPQVIKMDPLSPTAMKPKLFIWVLQPEK